MKRKLSKQTIFTILGILVIAGSIPMAVLLVKQRQEIRKEASGPSCGQLGGNACTNILAGSCQDTCTNLGNTYDCSPCWLCNPCGTYPPTAPTPSSPADQSCGQLGGNACEATSPNYTGNCRNLGDTYDCHPCYSCDPAKSSGLSCGAMGGTLCLQSGSCPSGYINLGNSTEPPGGIPCTPCCGPSGSGTPITNTNRVGTWGLWFTHVNCSAPPPPPATPTLTPTPTLTITLTPTPTPTVTVTVTPTPTPTIPVGCNQTCSSDANCTSGLVCYNSRCRSSSCPSETDCTCPGPTVTPTPTTTSTPGLTATPIPTTILAQVTPTPVTELPTAGFSLPTFGAILGGVVLILLASILFLL